MKLLQNFLSKRSIQNLIYNIFNRFLIYIIYSIDSDTDHESSHAGDHGRASSGSQTSRGSEGSSHHRTSQVYQQQISGSSSTGYDRPDAGDVCDLTYAGNNSSSWSAMPKMG